MNKTINRQLSNNNVIQYLHGIQMYEDTPANKFINVEQTRVRLCSENDSESSLSDPVAQSSYISSKESSDEEFDFSIGFEQYDASTVLNEPISDLSIDETLNDPFFKHNFLHDSTYTLCSSDQFSNYEETNEHENDCEQSTDFVLRSNSFTELPFDEQKKFVGTTPKKVVRFADMMVSHCTMRIFDRFTLQKTALS